jgi:S1-C subfamily serine protease
MRNWICLFIGLAMMLGVANAQEDFPVVRVVEQVSDSVVSIDANQVTYGATFGQFSSYERLLTNRVTGFIYTENGYILTDNQGIQDAFILTVITNDGQELEAEVVGVDDDYGLAVLKVEPEEPLKPAKIVRDLYDKEANAFPYEQGDAVIAIGYSGGFGGTVTYGIISEVRNFRNRNRILLPNVIQADVVINAGNEGCPLFNTQGEIIGFNNQPATGLENITFFMPMWLVCNIADQLISNYESERPEDNYEVWHPWLGIKPYAGSVSPFTGRPRTVDPALKMYLDIPDQYWDVGVLIDEVWPESPAFEYGLLPRDMIMEVTVLDSREDVKVEHQYIEEIEDLELLVTTAEPDEIFIFGVIRFGTGDPTYMTVEVVIGQHPGSFQFARMAGLRVEISTDYS